MQVQKLRTKNWNIEAITGYKPKTTFYIDFSIADNFGDYAIKDTFKRAFKDWKHDVVFLTELVMVLNWKIFEHIETNKHYANIYQDLYMDADEWAQNNLQGDDLAYYYRTID